MYSHVSTQVDQSAADRTVAVTFPVAQEEMNRLQGAVANTGGDRCTNARWVATEGLIPLAASRAVAQLG
jgi:hypothetical protein